MFQGHDRNKSKILSNHAARTKIKANSMKTLQTVNSYECSVISAQGTHNNSMLISKPEMNDLTNALFFTLNESIYYY